MNSLQLRAGGQLVCKKWNKEKGAYDQIDVTDQAPRFLWDDIKLAEDVTLNDVFLLLDQHLDIFDLVIGNWCKEFVREALDNPRDEDYDDDLASVELTWNFTTNFHHSNEEEVEFSGIRRPNFGATAKDGTAYAVSFIPTYNLKHLPLKLTQGSELFDEGTFYKKKDYKNPDKYMQEFDHVPFSLGDVLHGIIWEISFYGGPESRDSEKEELNRRVEEIKSGKAETIPMDDSFFKQLKADLGEEE